MQAATSSRYATPLLLIFGINLVQALVTPISSDEAYYWEFAQKLAWGYFDHPPMMALMIYLGEKFFGGILGVRFFTVLLSTANLILAMELIPNSWRANNRAPWLMALLLLAIPLFSVYGFITTADSPLLFFSLLYFVFFFRFIEKDSIKNVLLLGLSAALLMYSKYHGVLVILFSLLAIPKVFLNPRLYMAGITGLLLYSPHLLWQYDHDFISIQYHFIDRAERQFRWKNVLTYLLNTILVFSPFLVALVIKRRRLLNALPYHKSYMVILFATVVFFLISSFRDRAEPQWVEVGVIPFMLLSYAALKDLNWKEKWFRFTLGSTLFIVFMIRIALVIPLPIESPVHEYPKAYLDKVKDLAKGENVLFVSTYQLASKYHYYTGTPSFSINDHKYRKNQYDLWNMDDDFNNKPAWLVATASSFEIPAVNSATAEPIYLKRVKKWSSYTRLMVEPINLDLNPKLDEISFGLRISNPYKFSIDLLEREADYKFSLVLKKTKDYTVVPLSIKESSPEIKENSIMILNCVANLAAIQPDSYEAYIIFERTDLIKVRVSDVYKMKISPN